MSSTADIQPQAEGEPQVAPDVEWGFLQTEGTPLINNVIANLSGRVEILHSLLIREPAHEQRVTELFTKIIEYRSLIKLLTKLTKELNTPFPAAPTETEKLEPTAQ